MFHTDRLQVRKYTMDDLQFYSSLWGNEKVMRYIGNGTLKTYMQCKKSLEEWVIPSYKNGLGLFVLIEKETGIRIGHAGLVKQQIDGKEEIEIGYWLLVIASILGKRLCERSCGSISRLWLPSITNE